MAREIRIDIVGDSARFDKAAIAAAAELEMLKAELKGTGHNFDALGTSVRDTSGKIDPFTKDMQLARKASLDAGDALAKATKLGHDAGVALGDIAPNAKTAENDVSLFTKAADGMTGVLNTGVPLLGGLGTSLGALPALAVLAAGAFVVLTSAIGDLVAIAADLVAPLALVATMLGGLGAAFVYVTTQTLKNHASMQDQKDALLALHVAQQTYNQDLAKYGANATQTENALIALHKAQDTYQQAQIGASLGAVDLGDKLHTLGQTLTRDFAPLIVKGAQALGVFLGYLNHIAKLPLKEAFKSFSTEGVKMIGKFVDGIAKVVARPIRLAFNIAFGENTTFSSEVADWWHRFTAFLFGYTSRHRMHLPLEKQFAPIQKSHVDGIFQPLIDWFHRHDFHKQGDKIGQEIGQGVGKGLKKSLGAIDWGEVGKSLFFGIINSGESMMGKLLHGWVGLVNEMDVSNSQMVTHFRHLWDWAKGVFSDVASAAGHAWQSIQNYASRVISTIKGWWHSLVSAVESVMTVNISWPSPPSWLTSLGGIGSTLGGLIPHGATGGIVTRPTMALIGEAGPEAVVPLNRTPGSHPLSAMSGGDSRPIIVNIDGQQLFTIVRNRVIQRGVQTGQPVFRGYA